MEHTFNSPGCAYVRSMKGQDYIRHVLTQSKEGKDEKHPENSPDHAKSQKHSLVEKKYLDPSDLATRTDINGEIDVAIWTKIKEQIFSLTCESGKAIEETESDKCEIWTSDLMSSESARDKGNLDRNKHLPSNTKLEESDDEVPEIEHADSSSTEQIIYYTDISRRLESFIAMPSCEVAPDVCARAGFYFTGESLVCYSCCVSFDDWELEDPWMEHTIKSPGCDHVRSMKGQEYILYVLTKLTEGKDETNSENNPDHAKSQKDLLVEKKHLDSPGLATRTDINAGTVQGGKGDYAVRKLPYLGHLKLFDAIKGGKKPTVSLKTFKCHSVIVKYPYEASIRESKEDLTNRLTRKSKETSEFMRHLRQLSWDTQQEIHIHLYMVPDVMSRLSSYNIWPNRNIRTGPLVEAGFSCKDPNTSTVECKSCGLELNASALNGTTPMQYHREHSPDCEFFRQTNPQGLDGQRNRALADSLHNQAPSLIGINQETVHSSVQQPPGNNQQRKLNQGQAQAEKTSEANDTSARARSGTNDGNIRIDEATSPTNRRQTENASSLFSNNEAASLDSLVAERPRTGEVFDRATLIVPNNNNVTSSGEAMRENENIIAGAQGGEVPYPIRNSRFTEQNARRESYTHWPHRAAHDLDYLVNTGLFYTDEIPRIGNTTVLTEDEEEINLRDQPRIAGPYPYVDQ